MWLKITKTLIHFIILIISFECILPAFYINEPSDYHHTCIHQSHANTWMSSFLFEKVEEEEKSEEEDRYLTFELADFSKLAVLLAKTHTPTISSNLEELRLTRPSHLFKLFCIFLI